MPAMDQLSVTTHGIAAETDYSRQTNITSIGLRSVLADLYLVFNTSFCVIICDFCSNRAIFFCFVTTKIITIVQVSQLLCLSANSMGFLTSH